MAKGEDGERRGWREERMAGGEDGVRRKGNNGDDNDGRKTRCGNGDSGDKRMGTRHYLVADVEIPPR